MLPERRGALSPANMAAGPAFSPSFPEGPVRLFDAFGAPLHGNLITIPEVPINIPHYQQGQNYAEMLPEHTGDYIVLHRAAQIQHPTPQQQARWFNSLHQYGKTWGLPTGHNVDVITGQIGNNLANVLKAGREQLRSLGRLGPETRLGADRDLDMLAAQPRLGNWALTGSTGAPRAGHW